MANMADNTFYYSFDHSKANADTVVEFFRNWQGADIEDNDLEGDIYFESRWVFPYKEMEKLYNSLPDKDDVYMRCLSVEYGQYYHELYICDEDGWKAV